MHRAGCWYTKKGRRLPAGPAPTHRRKPVAYNGPSDGLKPVAYNECEKRSSPQFPAPSPYTIGLCRTAAGSCALFFPPSP